MTKSTSQRLVRAAESALEDAGGNVRSAADRITEKAEHVAEDVARRSRKAAAKVRKQVKKHPTMAGVIAGVAVALIGLGLVRRMGRA